MKKLLILISAITIMLISCGMSASPSIAPAVMRDRPKVKATITATVTPKMYFCVPDKLIYIRDNPGTKGSKVIGVLDTYYLTGGYKIASDGGAWVEVQTETSQQVITGWVNKRLLAQWCGETWQ